VTRPLIFRDSETRGMRDTVGSMRYLFGDSVPFPPQHDFLASLEVMVDRAVTAVALESDAGSALRKAEEGITLRTRSIAELETMHASIVMAARHAATKDMVAGAVGTPSQDYANKIVQLAEATFAEAKRNADQQSERERAEARTAAEQKRGQIRAAIEAMLVAVRLPVSESRLTMNLEADGCELRTALMHPEGLATSFALSTDTATEWKHARKVSEFAQGVSLPVGVKRSIFKRTVQPEPLMLDELFLGGFDLGDDTCQLRLRKKPDQPDTLVFDVRRTEAGMYAEVHHPSEPDAEAQLPHVLDSTDAAQLERLWTLLRSAAGPLQSQRSRVLSATLQGRDVFEGALTTNLVVLVVKAIAPTVAEIAKRSPNPGELSLKVEADGGRREEVYLKKSVLIAKLESVPFTERYVFEPLELLKA
jgi:hypothetical protein